MRSTLSIIGLFLAFGLHTAAHAQTAYVTDSLRLGLHRAADTSDSAFRTLGSGQPVEIISQNRNYAQVRLPDGTVGYVKVAFLVDEKPAKLIVNEVRAEKEALEQRLAELNAAFSKPAETIEALEAEVAAMNVALNEAESRNAELQSRTQSLESRQEAYRHSLPMSWVGVALGFVLLAGFLGGLWWTDYRSRKRHGGIRIY